jgi:hypothetical protein
MGASKLTSFLCFFAMKGLEEIVFASKNYAPAFA